MFARLPASGLDGIWGTNDDDYGDLRLLAGSPVIDAGDNGLCPSTDLRELPRSDGSCDQGAFEAQGFVLTITSGDNQITAPDTPFAQPLSLRLSSPLDEPIGPGGVVKFTGPMIGASITPSVQAATIEASGTVSLSVTANSQLGGPYQVVAGVNGANSVTFNLRNLDLIPLYLPLIIK